MLAGKIGYFRQSAFAPTSISGLAAWFDASVTSSLTIQTGVAEWRNLAGAGAVVQTIANNQPTLSTFANGRQALLFDGVNDRLSAATGNAILNCLSGATGTTLYCAIQPSQVSRYADIFTTRTGLSSWICEVAHNLRRHYLQTRANSGLATTRQTSTNDYTANTPAIAIVRFNALVPSNAGEVNRTVVLARQNNGGASGAWTGTLSTFVFGFLYSGGDFAGRFGEMLLYNRDVTDAENARIVDYLMAKWGVP